MYALQFNENISQMIMEGKNNTAISFSLLINFKSMSTSFYIFKPATYRAIAQKQKIKILALAFDSLLQCKIILRSQNGKKTPSFSLFTFSRLSSVLNI
jgi:hypothetical protein